MTRDRTAQPASPETTAAIRALITSWQDARADLYTLEAAAHPDITDRHGRVWTWRDGDLYRHCGNVAPARMINDFGLPAQRVLNNPNYDLCDVCIAGRERKVPDCKPQWNCSHTMHQAGGRP